MNACVMGHAHVCQLLLEGGKAEVDHADDEGVTALYLAAQEGHAEVCAMLLRHNADSCKTNDDAWRPLHIAAQNGHLDTVKLLTDIKQRDVIDAKTSTGVTPLYLAVQEGRSEVVRLLMERGANPDVETSEGVTAIHVAVQNGHEDIVKLLLKTAKNVLREVSHACRLQHNHLSQLLSPPPDRGRSDVRVLGVATRFRWNSESSSRVGRPSANQQRSRQQRVLRSARCHSVRPH